MASEATKRKRRRNPSGGLAPARKDTLMRRLEEKAGRKKMREVLEWSRDARGQALLDLMTDPAYRKHTFPKLCAKVGLRYHEALDLFRRFQLDLAILHVSCHLPKVMRDTAIDACSSERTCVRCNGTGERDSNPCSQCNGKGTVWVPGDKTCRKLIWDTMVKPYPLVGRNTR